MTDVQAVTEDVTARLKKFLKKPTKSGLAGFLRRPAHINPFPNDTRTPVQEFPPAVTYLNFPSPIPPWVLGQVLGPMQTDAHVKDPVYLTVVEVDGTKVGLTYGQLRLETI